MATYNNTLYDNKTNPAPKMVLKQELLTTEQTEYGIRVTRLKRQFNDGAFVDTFESEPVLLNRVKVESHD